MHKNKTFVIESDKIARIEGNGKIQIDIKDNNIQSVLVNIYEGPRLVEKIIEGKTINEVISIVPRICAICNISHKLASITAMEKATNTETNKLTKLYQRIIHMGEMIESHSLHLYLLVLPDLFKVNNAVELLSGHKETVVEGLTMKKFGNKIMYLGGGDRGIHGENPKLGGFGKYPTIDVLLQLKNEAIELKSSAVKITETLANLDFPDYEPISTNYICIDPPNNEYGFIGDHIITSTGKRVAVEKYNSIFTERIVPHSFAKRALHQNKPFTVGSIARLVLLHDRLTGKAEKLFAKTYSDRWKINPLYNNIAQAIELVYCFDQVTKSIEKMIDMLKDIDHLSILPPTSLTGRGVAGVEAPRGLLIHDYDLNNGKLDSANIVTPTALNLDDIERNLLNIGQELLNNNFNTDDLQFNLEMITRAYDPCISCSAHLIEINRE